MTSQSPYWTVESVQGEGKGPMQAPWEGRKGGGVRRWGTPKGGEGVVCSQGGAQVTVEIFRRRALKRGSGPGRGTLSHQPKPG